MALLPISMKVHLKEHNSHQRSLLCHPLQGTRTLIDTSRCANGTRQKQERLRGVHLRFKETPRMEEKFKAADTLRYLHGA